MRAGFRRGTMRTRLFVANATGFCTRPSAKSACVCCGLAERKTSNGKPWRACWASWFEPPNEARAVSSIRGSTSVSDAAARTVAGPSSRARLPRPLPRPGRRAQRARGPRPRSVAASSLDHHAGRLDHSGGAHPGREPSSSTDSRVTIATTRAGSVTSISTWRAGRPSRPSGRSRGTGCARSALHPPRRPGAARPRKPGRRAGWRSRARRAASLPVPAAERVEADPEGAGGLRRRQILP